MSDPGRKAHWENVYTSKGESEVSWFQANPAPSLDLIRVQRVNRRSQRKQSRRPRILCYLTCGYDIRATPGRCPECGTIPPNASPSVVTKRNPAPRRQERQVRQDR